MYKYEIHLHSRGCSACGVSTAEEMVHAAHEHGYAGVVFTNHFYRGNTCIDRNLPWEQFVGAYRQDYLTARAVGEQLGVDVLFGLEEGYLPGKELLMYGIAPELIADTPDFMFMNLAQMSDFIRQNGGFIACAHPFRDRDYIPDPNALPDASCFDGVEVHNACNSPEQNRKAADFTRKTGLIPISGGDTHNARDFGHSGVAFEERISDEQTFAAALRARDFRLIIADEPVAPDAI